MTTTNQQSSVLPSSLRECLNLIKGQYSVKEVLEAFYQANDYQDVCQKLKIEENENLFDRIFDDIYGYSEASAVYFLYDEKRQDLTRYYNNWNAFIQTSEKFNEFLSDTFFACENLVDHIPNGMIPWLEYKDLSTKEEKNEFLRERVSDLWDLVDIKTLYDIANVYSVECIEFCGTDYVVGLQY